MIQDIYPRVYHNEFHDIQPEADDCILVFYKNTALVRFQEGRLRYPTLRELIQAGGYGQELSHGQNTDGSADRTDSVSAPGSFHYLFSIDARKYFLAFPAEASLPVSKSDACAPAVSVPPLPGYAFEDVRIFRTAMSQHTAFAGITAHHLFGWYQDNQFCGRCGHPMQADHRERMLFCPACRNMVYPRISPAVIVGVIHEDKILMSRYAGRAYSNYALIAGFVEIGENVEDTVKREVMEEVGLRVRNLRYYKSQPWAFSGSLLMGFFCDLDGSDQITLDTGELAEAGWFSREEITLEADHVSLTREMIMRFKEGRV